MKFRLLILSLLVPFAAGAQEAFVEQVQKRDSILIADQIRYGVVLQNVTEGTPLALPQFNARKI